MQNKGAIQVFAVLLTLACLWHLSFTFVTSRVEKKAHEYAGDSTALETIYLDSMKSVVVYNLGFVKYTYDDCKKREINLGLDLKGGMNVTLEVSIPDLLIAMSNESTDSAFNLAIRNSRQLQNTSQRNYVDLFVEEFQRINPNGRLASPLIFGHKDQGLITANMKNEEVIPILKKEADQAINRTFEVLNARIDQFGVTQPNLQKLEGTNRILVELPGVKDPQRVRELLQATAKLEFFETYENADIYPILKNIDEYLARININAKLGFSDDTTSSKPDSLVGLIDQPTLNPGGDSLKTDTTKKDDTLTKDTNGLTNPTTMGGENPDKANPLFSRLGINFYRGDNDQEFLSPGPVVGYASPTDTGRIMTYFRLPEVVKMLPKNLKLRWTKKSINEEVSILGLVALKAYNDGSAALEGDVIIDASSEPDDRKGGFRVTMKMNSEGASRWADITKNNMPKGPNGRGGCIAIVLDDKVYSYPVVEQQIKGGISTISGNFSSDEADVLASVLKAGKLPTPANIVEQAVVGPTLGQKAIRAGIFSLLAAFGLILLYMVFYYGKAGLTADLALFTNVFFLIGSLSALQTTLTLPGIAGMVLTIGMAVDANVLIFERIKEELRNGKRVKMALEDGYKNAYSAIIDSNITTLITALILMVFGAGPVKGFAVVLFVGILTSMFSAIFISRLIFEWQLKRNMNISFSTKITENFLKDPKVNFVGRRKIFYVISAIAVAGGIASFATKGFNLGIDLKGGRSYTVVFDNNDVNTADIASAMSSKFGSAPVVKFYGSTDRVKVITKYKVESSNPEDDLEVEHMLYEGLAQFYTVKPSEEDFVNKDNSTGLVETYKVGPTVARDVKAKSLWAIGLSLIMIFLYILFRFRGWQYGLGALVALVHDVIIVLAVFSIFDGILPWSLEIDQAIIAAVLTVIGYSINDTVIIFDRIREFLGEGKRGDMKGLINNALNSTLARTVNTSLTVFIVLLISFLFGGEAVKGFAFAILVGVIVGTYSSLFIATPVVVDLKKDKGEDAKPAKSKK